MMALFKDKHPSCKRSLLSKLGESNHQTSLKEAVVKSKSKVVKVELLKRNPAVDIMSDIEGFSDWTLGRVRDFISCMDMARRKYTEVKENGPQMKLVPLVLNEDHEDTGEKYRGESGLRTWTRQMLDELVASRKRAIGRKKSVGGGVNFGKLLGDLWLEEFRSAYPDYKSSKKNLFRKYKWWRQRRAEMERDGAKTHQA